MSFVFLGCYTKGDGGDGAGIVRAHRDRSTGALTSPVTVAITPSPSFVVRHPERPVLYTVNEREYGQVSAFAVADDLSLEPLGSWDTGGEMPCHLAVDPLGRHLFVANYGSGSVAVFTLDAAGVPTGRSDLAAHSGRGSHPVRQEGPHAHTVAPVEGGLLAIDLGVDTVFRYPLDRATGQLGEAEVAFRLPAGTGPRHLALAGDRLYLVGELDATVSAFARTGGKWSRVGHIPASVRAGALPSEIMVSPDGRFLYVANRVVDTIAVFALTGGALDLVGEVPAGGAWPRHFVLVDDVLYVANERSHTVVVFRVDPVTGLPAPTGDILATPEPNLRIGVLARGSTGRDCTFARNPDRSRN